MSSTFSSKSFRYRSSSTPISPVQLQRPDGRHCDHVAGLTTIDSAVVLRIYQFYFRSTRTLQSPLPDFGYVLSDTDHDVIQPFVGCQTTRIPILHTSVVAAGNKPDSRQGNVLANHVQLRLEYAVASKLEEPPLTQGPTPP